jgi:uncharacterized protein (TIGR03067 family)
MKALYMLVLGAGLLQSAAAKKDEAIKKDKDALQGTWSVITVTSDGKVADVTKLVGAKVIFKDDMASGKGIRLSRGNECPYKLDPTVHPKQIDFIHSDGATTPGIYLLDGDKLKVCNTGPKTARPKKFESKEDSGHVLIILRRDK